MKFKIITLVTVALLSGCASTMTAQPTIPIQENVNAMKSDYRKTVEVIIVRCFERATGSYNYIGNPREVINYNQRFFIPEMETISVVETTKTGERFEMNGCFGRAGDRYKVSY